MNQNIKVITTRSPTYLVALSQDLPKLNLVFRKETEEPVLESHSKTEDFSSANSQLELTGNPLEVDLGDDDDDEVFSPTIIYEKPSNYTSEEAQQHPLKLDEARKFLNNQLMCGQLNECIYSVCNDGNKSKIVGLGAIRAPHEISRMLVYALPRCDEKDERTTVDFMKEEHLKAIRNITKIDVSLIRKYNLFGCDLRNCTSLKNTEYNGNIAIEISSSETNKLLNTSSKAVMHFQVVMAHNTSPLIRFWEELCYLQSLITRLEAGKLLNADTCINSDNNLPLFGVTSLITSFLSATVHLKKLEPKAKIDLEKLRETDGLDNLWIALKQCETLSDLRDSFHFFFEQITENCNLYILNENTSIIGEMVNGILSGKIAVPTFSFLQSLELLVELGLEKLKNDYIAIINHFHKASRDTMLKKWRDFCNDSLQVSSTKRKTQRKTRITMNPQEPITDLTSHNLKLSFLNKLHKIAEFIFLGCENQRLSTLEIFQSYCDLLSVKLLERSDVIENFNFKEPRLCHFSIDIDLASAKNLIQDKSPVSFSVKLFSEVQFSQVLTVFHYSQEPIFPPCVLEDNEDSVIENTDTFFFVSKLVKYTQKM